MSTKTDSHRGSRFQSASSKRISDDGRVVRNGILLRIPDPEFELIREHLEFIETKDYEVLHEPGEALDYAYFPNRGMVCVVTETDDGRTLEVGVVTKSGYVGEAITVGQSSCPYRLVTQPAINGFRVKANSLQGVLPQSPDFRRRLAEYNRFQCLRTGRIAACNRFHEIEQRLARWLLMSEDRLGSRILPFTHDFLASMLGTGRATVTVAAGILQKAGMIGYHRGAVKVVNRKGLEGAACECYARIRSFELACQLVAS